MHEVTTFQYHSHEFRAIQDGEQFLFVAKDVCQALEIENVSQACGQIPEEERLIYALDISGQNRDLLCITEPGLYRLIFRSNKPEAEIFRKWVFGEVLPAIRQTGSYTMPQKPMPATHPDLGFLREGEALVRELRLGVNVAEVMGLSGAAKIMRANDVAMERTGVDCLDYFGISDEEIAAPKDGKPAVDKLVQGFFAEYCLLQLEAITSKEKVFNKYIKFCLEKASAPLGRALFFKALRQLAPQIKSTRPQLGGKRVFCLKGLQLQEEATSLEEVTE